MIIFYIIINQLSTSKKVTNNCELLEIISFTDEVNAKLENNIKFTCYIWKSFYWLNSFFLRLSLMACDSDFNVSNQSWIH